jgi:hypothetical protein
MKLFLLYNIFDKRNVTYKYNENVSYLSSYYGYLPYPLETDTNKFIEYNYNINSFHKFILAD